MLEGFVIGFLFWAGPAIVGWIIKPARLIRTFRD